MSRSLWILMALSLAGQGLLLAGGPPIDLRCIDGPHEVNFVEDFRMEDLFRARSRNEVAFNPRALSSTYLSPTTLDFLLQRECVRIRGEFPMDRRLAVEEHREIDCGALRSLTGSGVLQDERIREEIQRDFGEFVDFERWQESLGPPRRMDFTNCY